jgi:tRNA-specific 2-thiouridylase
VHLPTFLQQKLKPKKGEIIDVNDSSIFPVPEKGLLGNRIPDEVLQKMAEPFNYDPSCGKIIGEHNGAYFFTIGQRRGMNVGGHREPLFVIGIDVEKNIIYTGEGQSHPGLYRKGLFIRNEEMHWIRPDLKMGTGEIHDYMVRIRYHQPLQEARVFCREIGFYIIFKNPQRGIAPGQFAAWYEGDEMIGSGVISR